MGATGTDLSTSRWAPKPTQKSPGTTSHSSIVPSPLSQPPLTSKNLVGPTNIKVKMSQPKIDPKLDNLPGLQTSRWAVRTQQPPVASKASKAATEVSLAACVVTREALRAAMEAPEVKVTLEPTKFDWADEVFEPESEFESEFDKVVHAAELVDTPASTSADEWIGLTGENNAPSAADTIEPSGD